MRVLWLADVLRGAGLGVVEEPDWQTAGKDTFGPIRGVMLHHTGAGTDVGLLRLIKHGRADLPGPLSHLFLDRNGLYHVIASGRTNHAGPGKWQGTTMGNQSFIGIEAANDGQGEVWPMEQLDAYVRGVSAILEHLGADPVWAVGHKEWALPKGRKVDPTFDMDEFREAVAANMANGSVVLPVDERPTRAMLKKGAHGSSVERLQKLLRISIDGDFGPKTEAAVKYYQSRHGLKVDGKVGPKTWASLLGE